ncbi:MAG: mechanosensitive ion channel family protein [Acidobacteriota bacterium]
MTPKTPTVDPAAPEGGDPAAAGDTAAAGGDAAVEASRAGASAVRDLLAQTPLTNVYLQALAVVLFAFIASWIVDRVISRGLARWARHTKTDLDDKLISLLHRPVRLSVLLIGLAIATQLMGLAPTIERVTLGVIQTLAVFLWASFAMRFVSLLLTSFQSRKDRFKALDSRTFPLFDNLAKILIVGAAIYFVFLAWNIDVTAWLASAGIIGIAVGFAAKDTLANLFAGLFIAADAPYKVGDYVNLDSGERGRVTQVGIRTTRMLTRDDIEITIPNSVIANAKIINESGGRWEKERLRVKVGVAYGSDVDQVRQALMAVAGDYDIVCADPEPRVRFRALGNSSLDFELLVWVNDPELRGRALDMLYEGVYKRFMAEGIEIPFPQRDVHLYTHSVPNES